MRKNILLSLTFLYCIGCYAQQVVKEDVMPYFAKLPTPPSTPKECYTAITEDKGNYNTDKIMQPLKGQVEDVIKRISIPNQEAVNSMNSGKQLYDNMQKDNVKGMTQDQQMEYMKTHGQGTAGMPNQGTMDFAQKMKDPAFKAQFDKMSPQEKMAYMQNSGMMNTNTSPAMSNAGARVADKALADGKKIQTDYSPLFVQQKKEIEKFTDSARLAHNNIDTLMARELKKLPTHEEGEGATVYNDQAKAKAIIAKYWNIHMQNAQKEVIRLKQLYDKHTKQTKDLMLPFNSDLAQIHYGDDIVNDFEKQQAKVLPSYQSSMFGSINILLEEATNVYKYGADWQQKYMDYEKYKDKDIIMD